MTEMTTYCCPACGTEIHDRLADGQQFGCANCKEQFRVLLDRTGGWVGMVPMKVMTAREPLGLPKGSIRAIATLGTAGCSWGLMITGAAVPGYVLNLLLATIGYYFGFRQKVRGAGGHIFDVSAKAPEPLGLPGGTIRLMLIGGFGVSALVLSSRGHIATPEYLEFFLILAGLVAGYFFSRLFTGTVGEPLGNLINHAKGLLVLIATVGLAILMLSDNQAEHSHVGLALACLISFYFGSRS